MKLCVITIVSLLLFQLANGQCSTCSATSFTLDLSASIDTSVSIQSNRNGDCCTGTNCIRFNVTMNPACSYVNLTVINPSPSGSAYYQVNCGPQISIGVPVCIVGMTTVCITYCKPGNDAPTYIISSAGALQPSPDITVREGCTGKIGVKGLLLPSINWKSVYPGAPGAYNSLLNCTTGCDTVTVSPQQGSPSYIDYEVGGNRLCGPVIYDTIRVYTKPQMTVAISPTGSQICPDGSSTLALTSTASGGDAPYNFLWNTGATTPSTNINLPGTYSVTVSDTNSNCSAITQQVIVGALPNPPVPTAASNSPLCVGNNVNLIATFIAGGSYSWTGPNGFSSNQQNPVISNATTLHAGIYTVSVTVNGCTWSSASTNVVVNSVPLSPSASGNGPLCQGDQLQLSASNIPNANYNWTGPNGFTSNQQGPVINNINPVNGGSYSVTATVNGCTSSAATANVIVNQLPQTPVITSNGPLCSGNNLLLNAASNAGASYSWTGPNGFNSSLQSPSVPNVSTNAAGNYFVTAFLNGCSSSTASTAVTVFQTPPSPAIANNGPVCEGSNLNLNASNIPNASYSWTGPNGFSSSLQNPIIGNISITGNGVYTVVVTATGCQSTSASAAIIVKPAPSSPVVSSNGPVCDGSNLNLTASTIVNALYNWSGPNNFSSSLQNPFIVNVNLSQAGSYSVTATVNGCTSNPSIIPVTIKPLPSAPVVASNSTFCTGNTILLSASGVGGVSYNWNGPNGFTSSQQNPSIANALLANAGSYDVSVTSNGCTSSLASTFVTVNQTPGAPLATNNGNLCEGASVNLSASSVPGATYNWTGPNGFSSLTQNGLITNATTINAGQYFVTATVNGCTSSAGSTNVFITAPSIVNAGTNKSICISNTSTNLNGTISGGTNTGIWSTNGGGSFSPSNTNLATSYNFSNADKAAGSVHFTLQSTNNGACPPASSSFIVYFEQSPSAFPGNDTLVCANTTLQLNGSFANASGAVWTSTGTGRFSPSNTALNAVYIPGQSDQGRINLTLTTTGNINCPAASRSLQTLFVPLPKINAGPDRYVLASNSIQLKPATSGTDLKYFWSPANYLNADSLPDPFCTPETDISYTITATDKYGCSASDDVFIKVAKLPIIPNVFTPNGDGVNEKWQIKYLADFADCTVEIFNRYGQLIYQSKGYGQPWDGTSNGKPVPAATYYYIINLKIGLKPLSGFVDIVR